MQEAVIGVVFMLGASGGALLLVSTSTAASICATWQRVGQIKCAQPTRFAWAAIVYTRILLVGFGA